MLENDRVARHGEAEQPVDERGEDQAGRRCGGGDPVGIVEAAPDRAQKVGQADDVDEAGVLEEADEGVHDPRDHQIDYL